MSTEVTREEFDALKAQQDRIESVVTEIRDTMKNIETNVLGALPEFTKAMNNPIVAGMMRMIAK